MPFKIDLRSKTWTRDILQEIKSEDHRYNVNWTNTKNHTLKTVSTHLQDSINTESFGPRLNTTKRSLFV